jgi:hypothetical protein
MIGQAMPQMHLDILPWASTTNMLEITSTKRSNIPD